MEISSEIILMTLEVGTVYKMEAPELIETSIPHYFLVAAINENDLFLLISTTQLEKRINYFKNKGYDLSTLAFIEPNKTNGLTQNSYFDCNKYFVVTKNQLVNKVKEKKLSFKGRFTEQEYNKIIKAINLSKINDIPKFLLKYK